jgi:hypothetical protein
MTRTTLTCQLAVAVAMAATAVPSAWARPIDYLPGTASAGSPGGAPPVRVLHVSPESDCDWADAGVGAAFAATMIGLGGTFAVRNNRRRVRHGLEAAS